MKTRILLSLATVLMSIMSLMTYAQAPPLGTAAGFVLFSTVGAVTNTGITQLTGNVGTNSGSSTGFGNVNGVMHDNDGASAQCAADVLIAYNLLNSTIPTFFPASLLGNGQTLNSGVYSISGAATLNLSLTLDAQGNPGAVFIFKIQGAFSTGASSKIKLVNGALACNVFWKVEGLVNMAAGTTMRGTVIANNAAIHLNTGDTLEGRALSTSGAITVNGVLAYTPIGCGSPVLTGPAAPALGSTACWALFSSDGPVSNAGITYVTGDIGTNVGLTTGYNPLFVAGTIHPIPDVATTQTAADLLNVYNYLNTLPYDIELLYPAQFGRNLVLTPHTYLLNAATVFTDTLYLNAEGNANAVFVLKIYGALQTSTYSKVLLINGAQAKNVFWKVDGAVNIHDYSIFRGTIVANNGAVDLTTGVTLEGRAFTTTGALTTTAITATMPPGCIITNGNNLNGLVYYDNDQMSPMSNTTVNLKNGNSIVATTTSDIAGNYSFTGLASGSYTLNGASNKPWGGGNATDALEIVRYFIGANPLTSLEIAAADVDGSHYVNSTDALIIMKRFVGIINSFVVGNWVFDVHTVTLTGNNSLTSNLAATCYGDVNGSYSPALKKAPTVFLTQSGVQAIDLNDEFEVPLTTTADMSVGAISLLVNYPRDMVEIIDVTGPAQYLNQEPACSFPVIFAANNGVLKLSWYCTSARTLKAGQNIITIKMRMLHGVGQINSEMFSSKLNFSIDGSGELADENAKVMMNVNLVTPKLIAKTGEFTLGNNQPNPFLSTTQITYALPCQAAVKLVVFNILGEQLAIIADEQKEAGIYTVEFNATGITPGVYYYNLDAKGVNNEFIQTKKMIVGK